MELTPPAMRAMRDRLAPAFAPVDSALMAAGDALGRAVGWLDGIRHGLGALQHTLDGPDVAAAIGTLDATAGAIGALAAGVVQEAEGIVALDAGLREVGGCIAGLLEVHRGLTLLAVNSAIVSSGIAEEGGDGLNFGAEIRSLLQASERVMRGYARSQEGALRQLGAAAAAQADFRRNQGPLLQDVSGRILRGLGEVAARRRRAGHAAGELRERADSIVASIGVTVAALQVGDATRQRIEHVLEGLEALADGLDGAACPWCAGLPAADRDTLAHAGTALQAALLRGAGEVFGAEMARITAALARLGTDAQGMVANGAALFGGDGTADGSFLTALERDLQLASDLLAEAAARRREVDQVMAAIDGMMKELRDGLADVHGASLDLRLIGLNAAFRSARLGPRGVALAAIARELRAEASRMAVGAEALSGAVERALAAGMAMRSAGSRAQAEALAETTGAMQGSLAALRAAGRAMDEAIARLAEDGGRAADALTAMSADLSTASTLAAQLAEAADAVGARCGGGRGASPGLLRERLGLINGATFTMAQERDIALAHGAGLPEPAAQELEDMLF
jgi:hypothetical protein